MTKQDFITIFRDARAVFLQSLDGSTPDDVLTEEERCLWHAAMGEDPEGNPLRICMLWEMYDAFMAAFVNSEMMSIPWSENVIFREFWVDRGEKDKVTITPSDITRNDKTGGMQFRFMATARVNGIDVPCPTGYPAWLFELDVDYFNPSNSNVSLYVKYREEVTNHLIVHTRSIKQCQEAVVEFLHAAYRHFRLKQVI